MNSVRILPPEIVAKIAAGEVIERPASVVKELLENSLDARASSLEISLKNAGKTLVRVKDNGSGIARPDMEKTFSRHATSKIQKLDDLYCINSLGFRGEALYSIAAVSDVLLRSKTGKQQEGWELHVRGEKKLGITPVSMPDGTDITVQELFFNTPARKKFLKSNTPELKAILDTVIPYCILYPEAGFLLQHEDKRLLELAPAQDLLERVSRCLHLDKKHLIEEKRAFPRDDVTITLVLGDINIQRTRKDMQFVFINNRPVEEKKIGFHINEVYRLLLAPGVYPCFACFITMPAAEIDVNVHPTKRQVKLRDEQRLIQLLRPFCESLLMTRSKARQAPVFPAPGRIEQSREGFSVPVSAPGAGEYQFALEQSIALYKTDIAEGKISGLKEKLRQARYLGNLLRTYLLFETDDSLLVVDQHAAQERIAFERLKLQLEKGTVEIQELLTPLTMKLTRQELLLWEESKDNLEAAGFRSSLFDKETLAVHSHPQLVSRPEAAVRNLLSGGSIAKCDIETLARRACRSSVMAGFAMNKEQAEFQRQALLGCADPFTCPHSRPTVVEIPETTLAKYFLRT
ncbi:MAG: DNA mismatch repair endonuclease MutL [Candidatus Omnitrophica bacterium]|nr:DNA mismatch repair endonuclease MutL [Candidatus Omnitrophota bacterium]